MLRPSVVAAASLVLLAALPASTGRAGAQMAGDTQAEAERTFQTYLAIWSDDARITSDTVGRFYAPQVSYYGRSFTRAQVLADKQAFIRSYPQRSYRELPGTFSGTCNAGRSLCRVSAEIEWRRTDRQGGITSGRSRLGFDFVPVDGGRKIARGSAQTLGSQRS